MKVTLLASGDFALPTLDALVEAGHELVVGTQPSRPAGRGRRSRPTAVAAHAAERAVPVRELADVNAPEALSWLAATTPDVVVVVAFGQKLGGAVRAAAPWGCLNIHPSLLPRWRGAAPVQAAVLAGDERTGVCIIDVVERMDAGAVLACRETRVGQKSAGELLDELSATGAELLVELIDALARDDVERRVQDEDAVTRARKLQPDDGRVRWEHTADEVDRRVRAVTPRPGAFTCLPDGKRLRILRGRPVADAAGRLPGEVVSADGGLRVACGQGAYALLRVQSEGGKPVDIDAWLRGHPLNSDVRFGP